MPHLAYPIGAATSAYLNITAATALASAAAVVVGMVVLTSGTGAGGIFDAAATGTGTASRQIAVIPATVGNYSLNWPCASGVVIVPSTGQVLAITLA